jgi:hypothetical protein
MTGAVIGCLLVLAVFTVNWLTQPAWVEWMGRHEPSFFWHGVFWRRYLTPKGRRWIVRRNRGISIPVTVFLLVIIGTGLGPPIPQATAASLVYCMTNGAFLDGSGLLTPPPGRGLRTTLEFLGTPSTVSYVEEPDGTATLEIGYPFGLSVATDLAPTRPPAVIRPGNRILAYHCRPGSSPPGLTVPWPGTDTPFYRIDGVVQPAAGLPAPL